MLKVDKLESEIKKAFDETLPAAFEQALLQTQPAVSKSGNDMAKKFGETINSMVSAPLAQRLAAAIDYHVRSISIYGTIITAGSPTTQMASINSPSAITNGKVPNSLGIQ